MVNELVRDTHSEPRLHTSHMKFDALQQYAKLRKQLLEEKSEVETKLHAINEALGIGSQAPQQQKTQEPSSRPVVRRGRGPSLGNSMSMREAVIQALSNGPVARKDLVKAVEATGYKFNTGNPLNSIGSVLYNKKSGIKSKNGQFFVDGAPVLGSGSSRGNGFKADEPAPAKKKRKISAAGRAAISAAAKARWAKRKAGK